MRCPSCGNPDTRVIDSREAEDGASIRRRRACDRCEERFTTFERSESARIQVVKRDGDLKLAALSRPAAVALELTRTGRLFEIYESSTAAMKSFSSFLPNALKQFYPHPAHEAGPVVPPDAFVGDNSA